MTPARDWGVITGRGVQEYQRSGAPPQSKVRLPTLFTKIHQSCSILDMASSHVIDAKCQTLLPEETRQALVNHISDAYRVTNEGVADYRSEIRSMAYGTRLWLEVQNQLSQTVAKGVEVSFGRMAENGFRYLKWTCGGELLLTVKRVRAKNQVVNDSQHRRALARAVQPYFDFVQDGLETSNQENMYGVVLHGLYDWEADFTRPSFVTVAFPNVMFTRYEHTISLLGAAELEGVTPDAEQELRQDVLDWLARPKRKANG